MELSAGQMVGRYAEAGRAMLEGMDQVAREVASRVPERNATLADAGRRVRESRRSQA